MSWCDSGTGADDLDLRRVREVAERQAVLTALARADGNIVNPIRVPPHEAELAKLALERMLAVS